MENLENLTVFCDYGAFGGSRLIEVVRDTGKGDSQPDLVDRVNRIKGLAREVLQAYSRASDLEGFLLKPVIQKVMNTASEISALSVSEGEPAEIAALRELGVQTSLYESIKSAYGIGGEEEQFIPVRENILGNFERQLSDFLLAVLPDISRPPLIYSEAPYFGENSAPLLVDTLGLQPGDILELLETPEIDHNLTKLRSHLAEKFNLEGEKVVGPIQTYGGVSGFAVHCRIPDSYLIFLRGRMAELGGARAVAKEIGCGAAAVSKLLGELRDPVGVLESIGKKKEKPEEPKKPKSFIDLNKALSISKREAADLFNSPEIGQDIVKFHTFLREKFGTKRVSSMNKLGGQAGFAISIGVGRLYMEQIQEAWHRSLQSMNQAARLLGTNVATLKRAYQILAERFKEQDGGDISKLPTPPGKIADWIAELVKEGKLADLSALGVTMERETGPSAQRYTKRDLLHFLYTELTPPPENLTGKRITELVGIWFSMKDSRDRKWTVDGLCHHLQPLLPGITEKSSIGFLLWGLNLQDRFHEEFETRLESEGSLTRAGQSFGWTQRGGSSSLSSVLSDLDRLSVADSTDPNKAKRFTSDGATFTLDTVLEKLGLQSSEILVELGKPEIDFSLKRFIEVKSKEGEGKHSRLLGWLKAQGFDAILKGFKIEKEFGRIIVERFNRYNGILKVVASSLDMSTEGLRSAGDTCGVPIDDLSVPPGNLLKTFGTSKDQILSSLRDNGWSNFAALKEELLDKVAKGDDPYAKELKGRGEAISYRDLVWGLDISREFEEFCLRLYRDEELNLEQIGARLGLKSHIRATIRGIFAHVHRVRVERFPEELLQLDREFATTAGLDKGEHKTRYAELAASYRALNSKLRDHGKNAKPLVENGNLFEQWNRFSEFGEVPEPQLLVRGWHHSWWSEGRKVEGEQRNFQRALKQAVLAAQKEAENISEFWVEFAYGYNSKGELRPVCYVAGLDLDNRSLVTIHRLLERERKTFHVLEMVGDTQKLGDSYLFPALRSHGLIIDRRQLKLPVIVEGRAKSSDALGKLSVSKGEEKDLQYTINNLCAVLVRARQAAGAGLDIEQTVRGGSVLEIPFLFRSKEINRIYQAAIRLTEGRTPAVDDGVELLVALSESSILGHLLQGHRFILKDFQRFSGELSKNPSLLPTVVEWAGTILGLGEELGASIKEQRVVVTQRATGIEASELTQLEHEVSLIEDNPRAALTLVDRHIKALNGLVGRESKRSQYLYYASHLGALLGKVSQTIVAEEENEVGSFSSSDLDKVFSGAVVAIEAFAETLHTESEGGEEVETELHESEEEIKWQFIDLLSELTESELFQESSLTFRVELLNATARLFLSGVSSDLGTAVTIAELIIQMIDEEESSDLESIRLASLEIIRGYDPENQLVIDEDQRVEELQRSEETKREVATIESGLTAPITEITALAEVRSKVERLLSLRPKHSVGLAWSRSLSLCRRILELRESIPESIQSEDQLTSFKVELESVTKSIEDDSDYAEQLKGLVNDSITVVETELLRKEVDFALEDTARKIGTGEIVRGHIFTEAFSRISKLISAMKDKVEPAAIKSWSDAQADLNTVLRKGESLEREVKELPQKARTSIPKPQGGPQKALLRLAGDVLERVKDLPVDPKEVAGAAHLFTLLEEFEGRYEAMKKEERHTGFLGAPFISCTAEIVDGLKRKLQL